MSGPIVRRYGFPNFDQIFGKKEPQHGLDEPATGPPVEPAKVDPPAQGKAQPAKKGKKKS